MRLPRGPVRAVVASLGCLVLAACVSIGSDSEPPEQLITLTALDAAPAGLTAQGDVADAIVIIEPTVEDRLDVKRIPVRLSDTGVAYLQDAYYVEKPARLFQHVLAETLRARTGRLVIEGVDPAITPRTRVHGRMSEMGYDATLRSVTVTYDAVRMPLKGEAAARRFSHTVENIEPVVGDVAPAINEAANAVASDVADWLTGG